MKELKFEAILWGILPISAGVTNLSTDACIALNLDPGRTPLSFHIVVCNLADPKRMLCIGSTTTKRGESKYRSLSSSVYLIP